MAIDLYGILWKEDAWHNYPPEYFHLYYVEEIFDFLHICNINIHLLFWFLDLLLYTEKGDTYVKGSKGSVDYRLSPSRQKWDSTKIEVEKWQTFSILGEID